MGVPDDDFLGENAGAAIVYRNSGSEWNVEQTLRAADGAAGDAFGRHVALKPGRALVFASGDEGGVGSGSARPRARRPLARGDGLRRAVPGAREVRAQGGVVGPRREPSLNAEFPVA